MKNLWLANQSQKTCLTHQPNVINTRKQMHKTLFNCNWDNGGSLKKELFCQQLLQPYFIWLKVCSLISSHVLLTFHVNRLQNNTILDSLNVKVCMCECDWWDGYSPILIERLAPQRLMWKRKCVICTFEQTNL